MSSKARASSSVMDHVLHDVESIDSAISLASPKASMKRARAMSIEDRECKASSCFDLENISIGVRAEDVSRVMHGFRFHRFWENES